MFYRILLLFTIFLLFTACGPVYKTDYTYTQPIKETGKTCVAQCRTLKAHCKHSAEQKEEICEQNKRIEKLEYKQCVTDKGKDKCYRSSYSFCSSYSDERSCDEEYRECFQSCGGKITSKTYCTSRCD